MKKINKNDRISVIIKTLSENPNKIFTLNYFAELLNCAKSTLSEDLDYIRKTFEQFEMGKIESISGAAGGIQYKPTLSNQKIYSFCSELCNKINDIDRIIPGGFIYTNDILYDPTIITTIGKIFANPYHNEKIDYVVTIETKGIPIALTTARMLNVPMIVVRKSSEMTEGTTIQTNYIAASSGRVQTMSLAKKALPKGSRVLFVDDFMKGGGTAKGIIDLMKEFEAEVVGVSVVMTTAHPEEKIINEYQSLLKLENIDFKNNIINIRPNFI